MDTRRIETDETSTPSRASRPDPLGLPTDFSSERPLLRPLGHPVAGLGNSLATCPAPRCTTAGTRLDVIWLNHAKRRGSARLGRASTRSVTPEVAGFESLLTS